MARSLYWIWLSLRVGEGKTGIAELLEHFASLAGDTAIQIAKAVKEEGITFSQPLFHWLESPMKYSLRGPISQNAYMVPIKPDAYEKEHYMLTDSIDSVSIQAISPRTKLSDEHLEALMTVIDSIDYDKCVNRHLCAIINLVSLINTL